ncbi:MAG: type V CRISPR-associated protein Cas12k [Xenococcus sp. MO_188.B8]|nr:type V CRISPR-associated protein Cas12k [Xenococcus sp. MO_188.B8]
MVNEILETIKSHPDLKQWLDRGSIPATAIKLIVKNLKQQPKFQGMPGRFFDSAERLVKQIYKSWFAVQLKKRLRLFGKKRWLAMLKSERELLNETGFALPQLQAEAEKVLEQERAKLAKLLRKQKQYTETKLENSLFSHLFDTYERVTNDYEKEQKPHLKTKKLIKLCALVYLLKNQCQIAPEPENPDQYQQYRRKKEIEIMRLEEQLKSRLPKGRNLDRGEWLEALEQVSSLMDLRLDTVPFIWLLLRQYNCMAGILFLRKSLMTENEAMELAQARLLRSDKPLPFSVSFETNTDIYWSKNQQGRICVTFNGMAKDGHIFEIFCHNRQLHWFQSFYEDYQLYKQHKEQVPGGLITLRSARLVWQQDRDSGKPWQSHSLLLHCSVETQLWTHEGTEAVRALKIAATKEDIIKKENEKSLTKNQQERLQANRTSLSLLSNFQEFSRPKQHQPNQNPSIIVGVSIGLQQPLSMAVIDVTSGQTLSYRNTRQLLSKPIKQKPKKGKKPKKQTQYDRLLLHREKQKSNRRKRHQAQINAGNDRFGESELGQYVDRLLAKAIVDLAIQYQASSIVLPDLTNIREILESEATAKAEAKIPGYKKAQKLYVKQYRQNIHHWSYKRLSDAISSKAAQNGIAIEYAKQFSSGASEMPAKDLALTAYHSRKPTIS